MVITVMKDYSFRTVDRNDLYGKLNLKNGLYKKMIKKKLSYKPGNICMEGRTVKILNNLTARPSVKDSNSTLNRMVVITANYIINDYFSLLEEVTFSP